MSQIGVTVAQEEFSIKQGSAGTERFTMVWQNADGSPLSTYDGWTCVVEFISPFDQRTAIRLTPTVTGNAGAKTLTFDMEFVSATTADLRPGTYPGDVCLTQPVTGLPFYPADIILTIEDSFAP